MVVAATRVPVAFSHCCAGALHEVDGCEAGVLEVVVGNGRRPRLDGVVVHQSRRLDPRDLVIIDGLPVTGLARTLADLGDVVGPEHVVRALDDVQRRGTSLRWLASTAARLDCPSRRGPRLLGELVRADIEQIAAQRAIDLGLSAGAR